MRSAVVLGGVTLMAVAAYCLLTGSSSLATVIMAPVNYSFLDSKRGSKLRDIFRQGPVPSVLPPFNYMQALSLNSTGVGSDLPNVITPVNKTHSTTSGVASTSSAGVSSWHLKPSREELSLNSKDCSSFGARNFIPEWIYSLTENIPGKGNQTVDKNKVVSRFVKDLVNVLRQPRPKKKGRQMRQMLSSRSGNVTLADDVMFLPPGSDPSDVVIANNDSYMVPNIVHYIWNNKSPTKFKFHHMLSVLSTHQQLKPDAILVHAATEPVGEYWDRVKTLPELRVVYQGPTMCLFGELIKTPYYDTSSSDVDRVRVLQEYGGIYLDFDVLVTRSFDPLRRYPFTLGQETETAMCGGIALGVKTSYFLLLWLYAYVDDYRVDKWAYNSGVVPFQLWKSFPHLLHVEPHKLQHPTCDELRDIYGDRITDWQNHYAIHMWYRMWIGSKYYTEEPNDDNVKTWRSTFGEIARTILYGSPSVIENTNGT